MEISLSVPLVSLDRQKFSEHAQSYRTAAFAESFRPASVAYSVAADDAVAFDDVEVVMLNVVYFVDVASSSAAAVASSC